MKEFITDAYKTAKLELATLNDNTNDVLKRLDKAVLKAIEGKTLHEINLMDLSLTVKNNKVAHLPAFTEMLAVGVDLRTQVQLSEQESTDIQKLKAFAQNAANSHVGNFNQYVQVVKGKAMLNAASLQYLELLKIKMDKKQYELWNRIQAVREYITKDMDNKWLLYSIFKEPLVNSYSQSEDIPMDTFMEITRKHNQHNE